MQTLIFDMDDTLTDMAELESAANERKSTVRLTSYKTVGFIKRNATNYRFVYATGGTKADADLVLQKLGIAELFDIQNSVSSTNCRSSKRTGIPFKRIKKLYGDCIVIGDSPGDLVGAQKAALPYIIIKPNGALNKAMLRRAVLGQGKQAFD